MFTQYIDILPLVMMKSQQKIPPQQEQQKTTFGFQFSLQKPQQTGQQPPAQQVHSAQINNNKLYTLPLEHVILVLQHIFAKTHPMSIRAAQLFAVGIGLIKL